MKPILFNTEMVRAILEGRKTVTRRKPFQMPNDYNELKGLYRDDKNRLCAVFQCSKDLTTKAVYAPYQPGDILWVRETWCRWYLPHGEWQYRYKATDSYGNMTPTGPEYDDELEVRPWRPSIHMPKEAARLFLQVMEVQVERLQEITQEDVEREGIDWVKNPLLRYDLTAMQSESKRRFASLWNSTIKPTDLPLYGWEANPWVWVIEFERISKEAAIGGGGDG